MKLRKISIALIVILSVGCLFAATASAAWYTCAVNNVGATQTGIRVRLTDDGGAFSNTWFEVAPGKDKESMATALTAISTAKKVLVQLNSVAAFSELLGIYIVE